MARCGLVAPSPDLLRLSHLESAFTRGILFHMRRRRREKETAVFAYAAMKFEEEIPTVAPSDFDDVPTYEVLPQARCCPRCHAFIPNSESEVETKTLDREDLANMDTDQILRFFDLLHLQQREATPTVPPPLRRREDKTVRVPGVTTKLKVAP